MNIIVSLVTERGKEITSILKLLEKVPVCIKLSVDQARKKLLNSVDERGWTAQTVPLGHCGEEQHFDFLCAAHVLSFKGLEVEACVFLLIALSFSF